MQQRPKAIVIGAGLAGSEAAWQLARRDIEVDLYEMRPERMTEAHLTSHCAELVCSNSFGSLSSHTASSILKEELTRMGAFVLEQAKQFSVPAGASLAVDREKFAAAITEKLESLSNVTIRRQELDAVPQADAVIIATGPLTSPALAESLKTLVGQDSLFFYDAISPIVSTDSLDLDQMYFASRYQKGDPDFLNVPLTKEQYFELIEDLTTGEVVLPHDFEEAKYFESCLPIEVLASRGPKTLAFGPLKPVGLEDPKTGKRPYAVIQLRKENRDGTAYNMVGFQTKLKYPEQGRIFKKLPGFENAEFLRLGSLHRNTFVDSPRVLQPTLQLRRHPHLFLAGQLTGTEGYLESSASGLLSGVNAAALLQKRAPYVLPHDTMLGGLLCAISDAQKTDFQPINANMGVLPKLEMRIKSKRERNAMHAKRAIASLEGWLQSHPGFLVDAGHTKPPLSTAQNDISDRI